jgi:hypothetical protein
LLTLIRASPKIAAKILKTNRRGAMRLILTTLSRCAVSAAIGLMAIALSSGEARAQLQTQLSVGIMQVDPLNGFQNTTNPRVLILALTLEILYQWLLNFKQRVA